MRKFFTLFLAITTTVSLWALDGALSGPFTINENGDQVVFSQGNLQYQASTDTWRFAIHQYDKLGSANENISDTCSGWIDLFGWGTGDDPTKIDAITTLDPFADWGINPIVNGGKEGYLWRTLSATEWQYIFITRPYAATLFGFGRVEGVAGIILLPDNWSTPAGIVFNVNRATFRDSNRYECNYNEGKWWDDNTYDSFQWYAMESAGAVFLPATGSRYRTGMSSSAGNGYWSCTPYNKQSAMFVWFFTQGTQGLLYVCSNSSVNFGYGVRLVHDINQSPTVIDDIHINTQAKKHIENGQLFILRGEKIYTVSGQEVQ